MREQFLLDPSVIYLNHGGFGACPKRVFEDYQRWQLELERQPTVFFMERAAKLLREARGKLAAYLDTAPGNLLFVTNTTTGVNHIARSLDLNADDEVLTTDQEYGAMERLWEFICKKRGAQLVRQPINLPVIDAGQFVEAFWSAVTPQTRVIFLSHITSPTSLIFPIAEICARARQAGILTLIDGAHAPGQIPLSLDAIGADFYAGNCHKWMCSPKGSAFLYTRPDQQPLVEPLVVSWELEDESEYVRFNQRQGTRDLAAFLAVPAAIRFMAEHDWPTLQLQCHKLAKETRKQINTWFGVEPLSPDSSAWFSQMFTVLLPYTDPQRLKESIYERYKIQLSIGNWNEQLLVRVSVQAYNTPEDLALLVHALKTILAK